MAFAAIGENPRAADSAGIPVHRYQWAAVLLNGMLGGLGGAYLVLVQVGNFSENMTSGRGYIALAAVIPVSYTHLDVYKRQSLTRYTSWPRCPICAVWAIPWRKLRNPEPA